MTFEETLHQHGLTLARDATTALQINVGRRCDLACRHCHLGAGPRRPETMSAATCAEVLAFARRFSFATIDVTGGAPELLPQLPQLVAGLAPRCRQLLVRTNLVALAHPESAALPELYRHHRVAIVASLPAVNPTQTEAQRGQGVWEASLAMLRRLNALGYGQTESGLELHLAANPSGAFLPQGQLQAERRFRQELAHRHGIVFTRLLTFANVPLGRYRDWLEHSGNLAGYQEKLRSSFNPGTVAGLMCCSQLSVDWDGTLFDCDFNLAAALPLGGTRRHLRDLLALPERGTPIAVGDHCFACTAGNGFTCGGSIAG